MNDLDYSKLVLENIGDCVFVIHSNGKIVFTTPSVEAVLGYRASEVIGRKIYELADEEYKESISVLKSLKKNAEVKKRALLRTKSGRRVWIEAKVKRVDEHIVVVAREISKLVSFETLMKAIIDLLRNIPYEAEEEAEKILKKYFNNAKFLGEVRELTFKGSEVTIPVKFRDEVLGSLVISLPDWFEVGEKELKLFSIIGECMAKNILILEARKSLMSSVIAVKAASESLALLIDRIRNPLAVINALVEVKVGGEVYEKVHEQVNTIEEILREMDRVWDNTDRLTSELIKTLSDLVSLKNNGQQRKK